MLAMAGDEGLEPSYLDLETSVLAAGRISRKLLAELTGVEPVSADRQSAILPIDHSSAPSRGLEPRFPRSERSVLPLDEEEFQNCQRTGCRGAIRTPVPGFKVQGPATRRPGINLAVVSLSCTAHTIRPTRQGRGRAFDDPFEHGSPACDDRHRVRNTALTQRRFQNRRVQSLAFS